MPGQELALNGRKTACCLPPARPGSWGLNCALEILIGSCSEFSLKGGGGVLEPKSPKVCVPKTAKSIFPFGKFHFSHYEIRDREGGVFEPPPGDAELLSKTLVVLLLTHTREGQGAPAAA